MDVLPTGACHVLPPSPPLGPRTRPLPHLSQGRTWPPRLMWHKGALDVARLWPSGDVPDGRAAEAASAVWQGLAVAPALAAAPAAASRAEPTLALPRDGDLQVRCSAARRHLHDAYEDRAASERLPSRVAAVLPRPLYSAALLLHPRCVASALQVCEAARCRHHGHPSHRQPHCRRRPVLRQPWTSAPR